MTQEYAFDIELRGAVRVKASSEAEARNFLSSHMDAMNCNGGAWPGGEPIVFEASIDTDKVAQLFEVDGEAPSGHELQSGTVSQ